MLRLTEYLRYSEDSESLSCPHPRALSLIRKPASSELAEKLFVTFGSRR